MAVTKVMEKDANWAKKLVGKDYNNIQFTSHVLCECGQEYDINEKFPYRKPSSNGTTTKKTCRSTECPDCKDRTFLTYEIDTWGKDMGYCLIQEQWGFDLRISTKAQTLRNGKGKMEDIEVEIP